MPYATIPTLKTEQVVLYQSIGAREQRTFPSSAQKTTSRAGKCQYCLTG